MGKKYDGSLLYDTRIDTKGFKKGVDGIKSLAKAGTVAVAALGTAVTAVGYKAIKAYGDYEQLVGGVQTLFKESADDVVKNAAQAFKTAQMSANVYMDTVTSFSASLLQSVGGDTQKAMKMADQAVIDMADNANKMGTEMQRIQDAYQGFAKQNFTMLDNLKLGYGGTKGEMERLLADAERIKAANGEMVSYSIDNFGDMTEAIHVIQTEMGITGTSAEEASQTIQGSINMLKGAWENLLTGLTDPSQDIDKLIDDVYNSLVIAAKNLKPRIEQLLGGIGTVITKLAPPLVEAIGELIPQLLPTVIEGTGELVKSIFTTINENLPELKETGKQAAFAMYNGMTDCAPLFADAALKILQNLSEGLGQNVSLLIPEAVKIISKIVKYLNDNSELIQQAAADLIVALADGIAAALPRIVEKIPAWIAMMAKNFYTGMVAMRNAGIQAVVNLAIGIVSAFEAYYSKMFEIGKNIVLGIWNGISGTAGWFVGKIKTWCGNIITAVKGFFGIKSPSRVMRDEVGKMLAVGIGVGISENEMLAITAMENVCIKLEKVSKKAERNAAEAAKKRRSRELKNLKNSLELELITEQEYYEKLKVFRDKYFAQGSDEWHEYTEEIAEYNKKMADEIVEKQKKAIDEQKKLIEKVKEMRDELAATFRGSDGEWFKTTQTIIKGIGKNGEDVTYTNHHLSDFSEEIDELERYRKAIQSLKALGNVPEALFSEFASLSVKEGLKQAETILNYDEEGRNKFLSGYAMRDKKALEVANELNPILNGEKMREAGIVSAESFNEGFILKSTDDEERTKFVQKLEEQFGTLPDEWYKVGGESADSFERGFFEKLPEIAERIRNTLLSSMSRLGEEMAAAVIGRSAVQGANSGNTYHNTYTFNSSRDTTTQQLFAARRMATLDRLRGTN